MQKILLSVFRYLFPCLQIVVDILHVFLLVELFEKALVGLAGGVRKDGFLMRAVSDGRVFDHDTVFFERGFDGLERFCVGKEEKIFTVALDVLRPGIDGGKFDFVGGKFLIGRERDDADVLKEISDGGHLPPCLFENGFDVGERAVFVIGGDGNHHGDVSGTVGFVYRLLNLAAFFEFAGSAFDGAINGVFRHIGGSGAINGEAKTHVHLRVTSAFARGNADQFAEFGKYGRPFGVGEGFLVFDTRPMRMSGHRSGAWNV